MKTTLLSILSLTVAFTFAGIDSTQAQKSKGKGGPKPAAPPKVYATGYTDTPFLPGGKWRVHDDTRPRPEIVTPGKTASDPPSDAIVLFDGTSLDAWTAKDGESPAQWTIKQRFMEVPPGDSGRGGEIMTKQKFGDIQLHIEWATPSKVEANSQGRGNSGVFFMERYEIQVLDSFNNKSYADGQASSIYGFKPPLVNASRTPGEWQTYDIIFEAPKWDKDGKLVKKAYVTVLHNGVLTHHRQEILGAGGHKRVAQYEEHGKGSIKLQDHKNPTRFRNIWVRELDLEANE